MISKCKICKAQISTILQNGEQIYEKLLRGEGHSNIRRPLPDIYYIFINILYTQTAQMFQFLG